MRAAARLRRAASTFLLLVLVTGCGGGSSGSPTGAAGLKASFVPNQAQPPANTVAMAAGAAQGDRIAVRVTLTDISGVNTASFDVAFDAARLAFVGSGAGDALEASGQTPLYVVSASGNGRVTAAVTLTGGMTADAVGTAVLVELVFRVRQAGSAALSFQASELRDGNLQPIAPLQWQSGTIVGN